MDRILKTVIFIGVIWSGLGVLNEFQGMLSVKSGFQILTDLVFNKLLN
jgi:hypothetical protein